MHEKRGPEGFSEATVISNTSSLMTRQRDQTFGGIETASLQMSVASLPHAKRMYATELLGRKIAPAIRQNSPKRIRGRAGATTRNM